MPVNFESHASAVEFFYVVVRTEYALKVCGYHQGDGRAQVDWDSFASEIERVMDNTIPEQLESAIQFILARPPRKQVVESGQLKWVDAPLSDESNTRKVFLFVRRTRNNLFHGGKHNESVIEHQYSDELLRNCTVVLREVVNLLPDVKRAFEG